MVVMCLHLKQIRNLMFVALVSGWCITAAALDTDQYEAMHVVSDTATYDRDHHTITYEGHVQVEQGTSHLDGDKVIIYQMPDDSNKTQQVIAYGQPAHYSTIPQLNKSRLFVEALKITYDPNTKTVLLEDQGRVTQDGNIFSGPHIWYDMVNGVVHSVKGPGNERTEVTIQPQKPAPPKN